MKFLIEVELKKEGDRERIVQFLRDMDADITEVDGIEVIPMMHRLDDSKRKSKYPFDTLRVGKSFKIPDDVKLSTMRTLVSRWHTDNPASGKRFSVFADINAVVRME